MRFQDLGPLCFEADGVTRPVSGTRMQALVGVLLVHLGDAVSTPAIIDAVWGPRPPQRAAASLDSLLWRLRLLLEPGRAPRAANGLLLTEARGYRLAVAGEDLDSHLLTSAAATVPQVLATGDPRVALSTCDQALAAWRGVPYQDLSDWQGWAPVQTRLTEVHLELQEHRIDALLALGAPERAVSDVIPLLEAHPFEERLWAQRMLGLHRAGRRAAALETFQQARRVLADELGLDPSRELQATHQQILADEPGSGVVPPVSVPARPVKRRRPPIGRDEERHALAKQIRPGRLVTLTGAAGVGKTRLALGVAEDLAGRFADRVWIVDLTSVTDPGEVAGQIVATLGVELGPSRRPVDAVASFVRSQRGDGVLVVLDNCEHVVGGVAAVVDELLDEAAGAPSIAVLATSREALDVDHELAWALAPLPTPTGPSPDELAVSPAVSLFLARLSPLTVAELSKADREAVEEICRVTDGLPLALELAAARARVYSLPEVATTLRGLPLTLESSGRGTARHTSLRAAIEDNHILATPDERLVHRRLAVLPTRFTIEAAIAVCGLEPLHRDRVVDLLAGLVRRSLLSASPPATAGGATTFRRLVPLHAHAQEALAGSGEETVVRAARNRWMFDAIAAGPRGGRPGQSRWYDWLEENTSTMHLVLTQSLLAGAGSSLDEALLATARLTGYWWDRRRGADALHWLPLATRVAGDSFAGDCARIAHASYLALNQEMGHARSELTATSPRLTACRPEEREAAAELLVVAAAAAWVGDDYTLSASLATEAITKGDDLGDPHVVLPARAIRAATELLLGRAAAAQRAVDAVDRDNQSVGNDFAQLFVAVTHAVAALFDSDPQAGLHWSTETLRTQRRLGVRDHGDTLEQRAGHYLNAGRPRDAARCYGAARAMHQQLGRAWPRHEGTAARLTALENQLGEATYLEAMATGERLAEHPEPETWLSSSTH